ncbi:MAG TPA: uroporphyrinogen-III synthase [Arenicellales bacterium]|nr:uroporphyrinogen-III synthase [Arenicellales bacterium]
MPTNDGRLAGIRVLITRPAAQASHLAELVRAAGGEAARFPTLEIEPMDPGPQQVKALEAADTVVFVSANAAAHGWPLLRDSRDGKRIIAVGRATARALRELGCADVRTPDGPAGSSEELLDSPLLDDVSGTGVCIVRGAGGREALKGVLEARGAKVSYLECYRRQRPAAPDAGILAESLEHDRPALVVSVTSVTGLANLVDLTPDKLRPRLLSRPLVVIGERQREAAREKGWSGPVLVSAAGDAEIVETIAQWSEQTR